MAAIRYIKRKDLDTDKWNRCIDEAANGLIYAYAFYLDAVCDNWDALVLKDYAAVMPLPWRKKWGIAYVYQPPFIQRLGVFGNNLSANLQKLFFQQANHIFRFIHYNVSGHPALINTCSTTKNNFLIHLSIGYPAIAASYTKECLQNIRKARSRGCFFVKDVDPANIIQNFKKAYGSLNPALLNRDYQNFEKLVKAAQLEDKVLLCGVKDDNENIIFSAAIFKDARRFYYVLGAPTEVGRHKRAPYFFIDHFLQLQDGQDLIFDFEGSDIPNVAFFYKQFNPQVETYKELKINKLPLLIRWMKK